MSCERSSSRYSIAWLDAPGNARFEKHLKNYLQNGEIFRWGKKWGKIRGAQKTFVHKKIQPPLSDWIF